MPIFPSCTTNTRGWISALGLFLHTSISLGTIKSMGVYFTELQSSLGTRGSDLGFMIGLYNGFNSGPAPVIACLHRHVACRRHLLLVGAMTSSMGFVIGSFVSENGQLAACLSIAGIGGCILSMCFVIALQEESGESFQILYGLGKSGYSFGMVLVPLVAEYLMNVYGWRGSMMILGAMFGNIIPLAMHIDGRKKKAGSHELVVSTRQVSDKPSGQEDCNVLELQSDSRPSNENDNLGGKIPFKTPSYSNNLNPSTKFCCTCRNKNPFKRNVLQANEGDDSEAMTNKTRLLNYEALYAFILHSGQLVKDATKQVSYWMLIIILGSFFGGMVTGGWHAFLIPRIVDTGVPLSCAILLLYPAAIACFIARALSGLLHKARCLPTLDLYLVIKSVDALSMVADALVQAYAFKFATTIVNAFCLAETNVLFIFVIKERTSSSLFPLTMAFSSVGYGCGVLIGTSLTGLIADMTGNYSASLMFLSAVDVLVVCLVLPTRYLSDKTTVQEN